MSRQIDTVYTGANISLYIGPNLVTDCFGISWELSNSKRPIYGYNSTHFDAIAKGQVIVLGNLLFNYKTPNVLSYYLQAHYAMTGGSTDSFDYETDPNGSTELGGLNLSRDKRRSPYAINSRPDQFSDTDGLLDPIDIHIRYGNPEREFLDRNLIETYQDSNSVILRNVHFIGESQSIMADDQPILEVYKFIARKKDKYIPPN